MTQEQEKYELLVEVQITKGGNYGNNFRLTERRELNIASLSQAAEILVRLHDLFVYVSQSKK